MNDIKTISDSEHTIAAVHLNGQWRFFYDLDYRFLLNAESLVPEDSDNVDESQIVDESNVEAWMQSLSGELTTEEIPNTRWEDGSQVKLTFVIDFDGKLWVGYRWWNDQSALNEQVPEGWTAVEDNVFHYLPAEICKLWDGQLLQSSVFVSMNGHHFSLISPKTRAGDSGSAGIGIRPEEEKQVAFTITRLLNGKRELLFEKLITDFIETSEQWLDLNVSFWVSYDRQVTIHASWRGEHNLLQQIAELGPYLWE